MWPTIFNVNTGLWEEVTPEESEFEFGIPIGPARESGGTGEGVYPGYVPEYGRDKPQLFASSESGVPAGYVLPDEVKDYHPVSLVTAYRPGGDWSMGVDPEVEGPDKDAHGNPILGRSTMEDYLEGNAEYVTVAMDRASSWQGQHLESPNYPGVPFKVMDNGGFGNNKTGNGWVDIAFRDPEQARNMTEQDVPFRPISEERAKEMVSSRAKPPEGFIPEEEYLAQQAAPQKSYFATREEELASGGRGPNYPKELAAEEGAPAPKLAPEEVDRIPLEGEFEAKAELPEGFVAEEEFNAQKVAEMTGPRKTLLAAIQKAEADGYKVPHFIGEPDEPEGDRAPTMDMLNLVNILTKQELDAKAQGDESKATMVRDERKHWEKEIAEKGMTAAQWKEQTGEDDPTLPTAKPKDNRPQALWQDLLNSFGRGAISDFMMPLQAGYALAARYLPEGSDVQKRAIDQEHQVGLLREHVEKYLPVDKEEAEGLAGGFMRGIGQLTQMVFYAGTGGVGLAGKALFGGVGVANTLGQLYQEQIDDYEQSMKAQGKKVDPEQAHRSAVKYLSPQVWHDKEGWHAEPGSAILEIVTDKMMAGKWFKALEGISVGKILKTFFFQGAAGGATEGYETRLQNRIAKELEGYDPDRKLDQGMWQSALIGALVQGTGAVAGQVANAPLGKAPAAPAPAGEYAKPAAAPAASATKPTGPIPGGVKPGFEYIPATPKEVPAPGFGPVASGVRSGLEENLSPETKGQAAPLAGAAVSYMQDYDESLPPAEAHQKALTNVPAEFKPAFQMLPRNAMEAEPAQFGEWLARAYEGGQAPAAVPGKSVAQMVREAQVEVETKESAAALEEMAAPAPEEAAEPTAEPSIVGKTLNDIAPRTNTNDRRGYMAKRRAEGATIEQAAAELKEEEDRVQTQMSDALPNGSQIRDPGDGKIYTLDDGQWYSEEGFVKSLTLDPDSTIVRVGRGPRAAPAPTTQGRVRPGEFAKPGYTAVKPALASTTAEQEGTAEPSTTADVEALVAKYQGIVDETAITQRKPRGQQATVYQKGRDAIARQLAQSKQLEMFPAEFPESKKKTITEQMYAIEDMVGEQFDKLGIARSVRSGISAGIAYNAFGDLTLVLNPQTLYQDAVDAEKGGSPKGLLSRLTNGEELIHAADLIGLRNEWLINPYGRTFTEFMADKTREQLQDAKKALKQLPAKDRAARLQALRDSWNVYFESGQKELPVQASPEEFLDRMIAMGGREKPWESRAIPIKWFTEFIRQAKQLERQGAITESAFRKIYEALKKWVEPALRRIKAALPGAQEGKFGKAVQQRLQMIDDVLAGREEVTAREAFGAMSESPIPVELYNATPNELEMIAAAKAREPLVPKVPKTIINIGMFVGEEGGKLNENEIRAALEKWGVKVVAADILDSVYEYEGKTITEPTFVAELASAMDETVASNVAVELQQNAITQRVGVDGDFYGPKAESYRPFKEDYFLHELVFKNSVERLEQIAKDNEEFKDWYDRLDDAFAEILKGLEQYTPLVKELLAALSQVSGVKGNVTEMVRVLRQFIETGTIRGMLDQKRDNMIRLLRGEKISGPKVGPFSAAMHGIVDATAIDRHVATVLFGTKTPSALQHRLGHERIAQVAARLGWTNRQLQAALFAADIREQGKPVERYEDSIRAKQVELRDILSRDITGRGAEASRRIAERVGQRGGVEEGVGEVIAAAPSRGGGAIGVQAGPPPAAPAQATGAPIVGPTVAPVGRDIERFFFGAAQVFDKVPGLKPLGDAIRRHVDLRRQLNGRFGNPYRLWLKQHGMNKAAMKTAQEYWEAEDSGRATDATAIRNSASPEGKALIDTEIRTLTEMYELAEKEGYMVQDPKSGRFRPFKKGAHLFPRVLKADVIKIIERPNKSLKEYRTLRDELVNAGAVSVANADAETNALLDKVRELRKTNDAMGNVDLLRSGNLPTQLFDYSFPAIRRFTANFSEAMARRMALGQKTGGRGKDIFDLYKERAGDQHTRDYIEAIQRNAYNTQANGPLARLAMATGPWATFAHLANWRSVIRNWITGTAFSAQHFGVGRTLEAMTDLKGTFQAIEDAHERGVIQDDILQIMSDGDELLGKKPGVGSRLAQAGFKYSGWNAVEQYLRGVSFQAAKAWLRYAIKQNKTDPRSKASLIARGRIQRLGIDANDLLAEGGDGPLTDRFFRSAVNEIQGGYQYDQVPGFVDSPEGRFYLKYRKFGTQALMHFDREVARPFARAVSSGRWAAETVEVRDPVTGKVTQEKVPGEAMKVVAFLALMVAAGAGEEWLAEHLFGIPKKNATFAEIFSRMGRDKGDAVRQLLLKTFGYLVNAGGFGLLAEGMQVGVDYFTGKQPRSITEVPGLAIPGATIDLINDLYKSGAEQPARQVDNFLKKTVSAYRTTGQMAAQGMRAVDMKDSYFQSISRKQDLAWLRGVTRRFNDEMEVQRKPGLPGRPGITPETPFRDQLKDYLLVGDTRNANKLLKDHFKGWSSERQKEEMENLTKSVRGSQPIKAGSGGGEAMREAFLRWTRTALAPAEQVRLRDIDKTYRDAARLLKIWEPKAPKEKDIEKAMKRIEVMAEERE